MSSVVMNPQQAARRQPPVVRGHWLWGTMRAFQRSPLATMVNLTQAYGDGE